MTDSAAGGPQPSGDERSQSDAERVLAQALRAMAGGPKPGPIPGSPPLPRRRLSTLQVLLIAALVGLLIGVAAGSLSLVL